jgi:hypothetical protein
LGESDRRSPRACDSPGYFEGVKPSPLGKPSRKRTRECLINAQIGYQGIRYWQELNRHDLSGRIRTCGQDKLNAQLFGEDRVDVVFEDQWIDNSSMADRDPTFIPLDHERFNEIVQFLSQFDAALANAE